MTERMSDEKFERVWNVSVTSDLPVIRKLYPDAYTEAKRAREAEKNLQGALKKKGLIIADLVEQRNKLLKENAELQGKADYLREKWEVMKTKNAGLVEEIKKLEKEDIGELIKRLCDKNIISTIMCIGNNESFQISWYTDECFMDWEGTDYDEDNDFETHAPTLKEVLEKACNKSDEFYATGKFKWDG